MPHFIESLSMSEDRAVVSVSQLARWMLVAGLVVLGIVLYFIFAPDSRPVATPTIQEMP